MSLKCKSKMLKSLVEKIDTVMSDGTDFNEIAGKLKTVHVKIGDQYYQPLSTDLCTQLAKDELESR